METKKILLIDDEKDFIEALSILLNHAGYEIHKAYSGSEGFLKVQEVNPDLIILDVNMENENAGFDLNRKIRSNRDFSEIPIIMLTGIETYAISSQILEMYNTMVENQESGLPKILRIGTNDDEIGVQYIDDNGKPYYLPLDCFVPKINSEDILIKEIKRLIG